MKRRGTKWNGEGPERTERDLKERNTERNRVGRMGWHGEGQDGMERDGMAWIRNDMKRDGTGGEGLDGTGRRGTGRHEEVRDVVERHGAGQRGTGQGGEVVPLGSRVVPLHSIKSLSVPSRSLFVSSDHSLFHLGPLRSIWSLSVPSGLVPIRSI